MRNIDEIRKRFPERLLEIEMTRRVKPHSLVNQIRRIKIEKDYNIDFDMDSLVEATVNKTKFQLSSPFLCSFSRNRLLLSYSVSNELK